MQSTDVKANENFYLHVNKKWLEDPKNVIPADYPRWVDLLSLQTKVY